MVRQFEQVDLGIACAKTSEPSLEYVFINIREAAMRPLLLFRKRLFILSRRHRRAENGIRTQLSKTGKSRNFAGFGKTRLALQSSRNSRAVFSKWSVATDGSASINADDPRSIHRGS